MGLFSKTQIESINKVAEKSKESFKEVTKTSTKGMSKEISEMSDAVIEYFKDSEAICVTTKEELHDYVSACIEFGYAGIDTETTGLDRTYDTIVGASLYVPGRPECYIPMKHLVPIFDTPYKGQLSYEDVGEEFRRMSNGNIKLIFANADFDLAMIRKDLKANLSESFYYDVILAWRCLKENELDNSLKGLYNKYCLKGKGDPKKFRDFFTPKLFPYCKPEVAKLYAANDAYITFELFKWQLPYVTPTHPKCKRNHLEAIASLVWDVEFPMVSVCHRLHNTGMYIDKLTTQALSKRYVDISKAESQKLAEMVDEALRTSSYIPEFGEKVPFVDGKSFNPKSPPHVKYLLYKVMGLEPDKKLGTSTNKEVLKEINIPITNQILKVRSLGVLISTFVEKLPKSATSDSRIHANFKQMGASTGRMSSESPNLQNIPSHALDIRHMFRATAASNMIEDCSYNEDSDKVEVSLNRYNKVDVKDKGLVSVHDLCIGDEVKLLEDRKEVYRIVKEISDSNSDACICNVVF